MQAVPGRKSAYDRKSGKALQAAEAEADYRHMDGKTLAKYLQELEDKMYQHARDLEFEQAAAVRDQINKINDDLIQMA
jgi:excinuclease ABC subunit B